MTDASKFGRRGFIRVTGFDQVDQVLTEAPPPPDVAEAMGAAGVKLLLSGHPAET